MLTALLEFLFYKYLFLFINTSFIYLNTVREIRMMSVVVRNSERHSQTDIQQTVKKRYEEAYK